MGCFDSGGSKTTSTSKTKAQKKGLKAALGTYLPTLGKGTEVYPESRVAPFSALQQTAISGAGNYIDYFSEPKRAGTPLFEETGEALGGLLSGTTGATPFDPKSVEDYFQGAIYDPTMRNLEKDVLPGVDIDYSGPGFWNAARSHERSDRRQETAELLSSQRAGLEWDTEMYNRGLAETKAGRTQTAVTQGMAYGQVPAQEIMNNLKIASSQIGGLASIFGIGQAEQTQAQKVLQDDIMRFAEENQITDPENLSIILALLGMNYSTSSGSSSGPGLGYVGISAAMGQAGENLGNKFFV